MAAPLPLPGLQPASWRGVPFHVPSATRVSGRRLAEFELAASDVTLREDLGLLSGPIEVEGVYAGDDYIAVEAAFRAACEQPGPGTLVHPWYGPLTVELVAQCETRFEASALRSFSLRATFKPWRPASLARLSTVAAALGAAGSLLSAAAALTGQAFQIPYAESTFRTLAGVLGAGLAAGPGGTSLAALGTLPTLSPLALTGASAASWQTGWMSAVAAAGAPPPTPAVAAGPAGRDLASVVPALTGASALWALAGTLAAIGGLAPVEARLRCALRAAALAGSVTPLLAASYESRQEATAWRTRAAAAFDAAMADAAVLAATVPAEAGAVWRGLQDTRRRALEDIDERIGRLPSVIEITPPSPVSCWLVAHHVAGDDPSRIVALMQDIARRNRLRHPAVAGPQTIETLP